jgi:hypothetical protein
MTSPRFLAAKREGEVSTFRKPEGRQILAHPASRVEWRVRDTEPRNGAKGSAPWRQAWQARSLTEETAFEPEGQIHYDEKEAAHAPTHP